MIDEKKIRRDALLSTLGGVDSGRSPSLLAPNQLAFGVNVTLRGGFPATRPRETQKTLSFTDDEQQEWFEDHPLQGRGWYYPASGRNLLIVSIGGRIFTIAPANISGAEVFQVKEITPTEGTQTDGAFVVPAVDANVAITVDDATGIFAGYPINVGGKVYVVVSVAGNVVTATNINDTPANVVADGTVVTFLDPNATTRPKAWMVQAEQYFIIQNGLDGAIIYDGTSSHRADTSIFEVPSGTAMVYNEEVGRLAVAVAGNQIAFGDYVESPTSSVIIFKEETVPATGGRFRIPLKFGTIVAMEMTANLNRANGQGPMVIFAERGVSTLVLPANRLAWQNLTYPVQVNMPLRYSATAQDSVSVVNADLYYRAPDGWRSLVFAVQEFQTPGNVPISSELARVLDNDDRQLLAYGSSMLFDNRLLLTADPVPSANGVYHRGYVSMDFDLVSRMAQKAPPTFDGLWTSTKITSLIAGTFASERAFIFAINSATLKNELWELHRETGFNELADGTQVRIQCAIETRAMDCGRPVELKKLAAVEAWLDQVVGEVLFVSEYRPDDYHCYFPIGSKTICQDFEDCSEDEECKALRTFSPGYRTRIAFGQPPDAADEIDNKPAREGYVHQIRLAWKGQCRLRKMLMRAEWIEESMWNVDRSV